MLITLREDADPKEVKHRLAQLGVFSSMLRTTGGRAALTVDSLQPPPDLAVVTKVVGVADVFDAPSPHPRLDGHRLPRGTRPQLGAPNAAAQLRSGGPRWLMAGPCAVESRDQILACAEAVRTAGGHFLRGGAFKPRTSPHAFSGHGLKALGWLRDAADRNGLAVVTEVLSERDVQAVAECAELLQVGSRNMQNYALLKEIGKSGADVLLKRGVGATLKEWLLAGEHLYAAGANEVVFCERGVRGFDPHTRNMLDLAGAAVLRAQYGVPVVIDPSHAAGRRDLVLPLGRAAMALGADGLLVEFHPNPSEALSDGSQAIGPVELGALGALFSLPPASAHSPRPSNPRSFA